MSRYLLCRPRGGLNDIFFQIWCCRDHARRHNRILIVDTRKSFLNDEFSAYFRFRDTGPGIIENTGAVDWKSLVQLTANAQLDEEDIYLPRHDDARAVRFDFAADHAAQLLIHRSEGGGPEAQNLVELIRPGERLTGELRAAVSRLPTAYDAVHIRNTDYSSDPDRAISQVERHSRHPNLLVCTDDEMTQHHVTARLSGSRNVVTVNKRFYGGRPIHYRMSEVPREEARENFVAAFSELIGLAKASRLIVLPVKSTRPRRQLRRIQRVKERFGYYHVKSVVGSALSRRLVSRPGVEYSGFSTLAYFLHRNPHLWRDWL